MAGSVATSVPTFTVADPVRPIFFLLLAGLTRYVYRLLADPLNEIPGPFAARLTRLWLACQYLGGRYQRTNIELHRKYGPIVRIAPGQYSIDDPSALKVPYGHGSQLHKSEWYIPWGHPDWRNLLNILDPQTHAAVRRKLSKPYAMSSLVGYEPYVGKCTRIFKSQLTQFAELKQPVNMGRWFQLYAFDMIAQTKFSRGFGFLETGRDVYGAIKMMDGANGYASLAGSHPTTALNIS